MEDGAISAIYDHNEALRLKREQLRNMGLRPFQAPAFQVGGAFQSKPEDTLQVSEISCMLDGQQILEEVSLRRETEKSSLLRDRMALESLLCAGQSLAYTGRWERCRLTGNI